MFPENVGKVMKMFNLMCILKVCWLKLVIYIFIIILPDSVLKH